MNLFFSRSFSRILAHMLFFLGLLAIVCIHATLASAQTAAILLASKSISLENRAANKAVNEVFKENILLTASYLQAKNPKNEPDWQAVTQPFTYDFSLKPGETFAYHDTALPKYAQTVIKTTNSHFGPSQGFKSDGYLMGNGVCHFASLLYWAAKDAGITAEAPVNHDFAAIADIDKKYGVAIYVDPANPSVSAQQNLYIQNNQAESITFRISYDGSDLRVQVLKFG